MKQTSIPSRLSGLKFRFLQKDEGNLPNNCPPVHDIKTGKVINREINETEPDKSTYPANEKYKLLGFYPVYKIFRRGFTEAPEFNNFDYLTWWKNKCSTPGETEARITEIQLIENLDKMQKQELGDLTTGATTLLGFIGRKSVIDGNMDTAGKVYDKLMNFADYIEKKKYASGKESKYGKSACDATRKENCDDSISRVFESISWMTMAAKKEGTPSKTLLKRPSDIDVKSLGDRPTGDEFKSTPYKTGTDTILRCMVESENGSLKRDQCIEATRDIAIDAVIADKPDVYNNMIDYLGNFYNDPDKTGGKIVDVETWVNSTVWLADGLLKLLSTEKNRGTKFAGTSDVLKTIKNQKKETKNEFSTADWITQQAMIVSAADRNFNRHDQVFKEMFDDDRIGTWNTWLDVYLNAFPSCGIGDKRCMGSGDSDMNKALQSATLAITKGCLIPASKNESDVPGLESCSKAISAIIEKSGDDKTLGIALQPWFMFAQKDAGVKYIDKFSDVVNKGIVNRFNPGFIQGLDGSVRVAGWESTRDGKPVTIEHYEANILKNRDFKKEGDTLLKKKYRFVTITGEGGISVASKIVDEDTSQKMINQKISF